MFRAKFNIVLIVGLFAFVINSCGTAPNRDAIMEQKIDSILSIMTLEEKIGQMSQVRHFNDISKGDVASKFIGSVIHTQGPLPGNGAHEWQQRFTELQNEALSTRLGIPLLIGVDAVHGQNTYEGATIFPHNIGLGATRNPDIVSDASVITAIEMQATGFNWTFSPCIAIPYNEKWGRVYEAYSESTELTAELAKASVEGYQGDLMNSQTVMATAKHYLGEGSTDYGQEGGTTTLSVKEIHERLLPPYKEAVKAGVGAVMVAFNSIYGQNMHAHKELITDTLKNGMNFDGIVVTDWQGFSRFGKNDIINAGVDMVMSVDGNLDSFQSELKKGVENDSVPIARIDDAVRRILRQKYRLGLFDNPYPDSSLISLIGCQEHRDKARQAVRQSLVLLKNKDNILPINKNIGKIVVVGEHADNSGFQSGGWTVNWQGTNTNYKGSTTILQGINKIALGEVIYDTNAELRLSDADIAIIIVGETPYVEWFGDIGDGTGEYKLTLSEKHENYINTYVNMGVKTVAILVSGRPLVITEQLNQVDAFIAAWLPGSEGDGIAEVVFGDYNFSGKLPHSWPESTTDFNGKYGPNYWDAAYSPLFQIGYGLQYPESQKIQVSNAGFN